MVIRHITNPWPASHLTSHGAGVHPQACVHPFGSKVGFAQSENHPTVSEKAAR